MMAGFASKTGLILLLSFTALLAVRIG